MKIKLKNPPPAKFIKNINATRRNIPILSSAKYDSSDKNKYQTLLPSSGGIGTKLKMPNAILITTRLLNMAKTKPLEGKNLIRIAKRAAKMKFEIGPAMAVRKLSRRGLRKFLISTITGLAQPKAGA